MVASTVVTGSSVGADTDGISAWLRTVRDWRSRSRHSRNVGRSLTRQARTRPSPRRHHRRPALPPRDRAPRSCRRRDYTPRAWPSAPLHRSGGVAACLSGSSIRRFPAGRLNASVPRSPVTPKSGCVATVLARRDDDRSVADLKARVLSRPYQISVVTQRGVISSPASCVLSFALFWSFYAHVLRYLAWKYILKSHFVWSLAAQELLLIMVRKTYYAAYRKYETGR